MQQQSERKRVPPRFNAAWFCTSTEEAQELQRIVAELIHDHEPISMAEVLTIQRVALMQWKALRAARIEAGVVQSLADARLRYENGTTYFRDIPGSRPEADSADCTELIGRAVKDDCGENRAYVRIAAATAVADREYHRCLAHLDHVRGLRAGQYAPGARKPVEVAETSAPAAAPAVFTAA